jgi:sec-independent protein translocase protein TatB
MLSLSPAKLLVVLVVALIVLGPEKLPQLARQLGAAWGDLRRFRQRLESDVRGAFPDLPPAHEVAQAVRSPLAFLDRLADEHERTKAAEANGTAGDAAVSSGPSPPSGVGENGNGSGGHPVETAVGEWGRDAGSGLGLPLPGPDDPTMN